MIEISYSKSEVYNNNVSSDGKLQSSTVIYKANNIIDKMLEFNTIQRIVILFSGTSFGDVICIDFSGKLIWQLTNSDFFNTNFESIDIEKIDTQLVKIFNIDSSYWILKTKTGELVIDPDESMQGRRPW